MSPQHCAPRLFTHEALILCLHTPSSRCLSCLQAPGGKKTQQLDLDLNVRLHPVLTGVFKVTLFKGSARNRPLKRNAAKADVVCLCVCTMHTPEGTPSVSVLGYKVSYDLHRASFLQMNL